MLAVEALNVVNQYMGTLMDKECNAWGRWDCNVDCDDDCNCGEAGININEEGCYELIPFQFIIEKISCVNKDLYRNSPELYDFSDLGINHEAVELEIDDDYGVASTSFYFDVIKPNYVLRQDRLINELIWDLETAEYYDSLIDKLVRIYEMLHDTIIKTAIKLGNTATCDRVFASIDITILHYLTFYDL